MDAAGAETLRLRLEQQRHWSQAEAVRDGRQPRVDPDIDELEELSDGIRRYSVRRAGAGARRMCKRLVDGMWQYELIDEQAEPIERHEETIAHVA